MGFGLLCAASRAAPRLPAAAAAAAAAATAANPSSLYFPSSIPEEKKVLRNIFPLFSPQRSFSTQQQQQQQQQHQAPSSSSAAAAAAAAAEGTPKYRLVPFIREDISAVMQEVPDFKYYFIGNEQPSTNPYQHIPMDIPILPEEKGKENKLPKGDIEYSILENGFKIASVDRGGLVSSLGLFVNTGTRWEDPANFGVCNMLQCLSFHSTAHLSFLRTVKSIEQLGANANCIAGREQIVYSAECMRSSVPLLIPLLIGNCLFPRLLDWEIKSNINKLMHAKEQIKMHAESYINELMHAAAYHNNTLGFPLHAKNKSLNYFNAQTMRQFLLQHFYPENMVFVGINVNHDSLCRWLMRSFVDYVCPPNKDINNINNNNNNINNNINNNYINNNNVNNYNYINNNYNYIHKKKSIYTGGDRRVEAVSDYLHLAIAYETPGGWNNGDIIALSVLQTLIGGGGSFSTGGPGKGMYTRLYINILNNYFFIDSSYSFNTQYSDSGLFGLYFTTEPAKAATTIEVMADEFSKMEEIKEEEIKRAKNSLKASIYMNLENRHILLEDIGRQLMMSGRVISPQTFCQLIDQVQPKDIQRVCRKMFATPPTVVAYGDISYVPHYEEIKAILNKAIKQNK